VKAGELCRRLLGAKPSTKASPHLAKSALSKVGTQPSSREGSVLSYLDPPPAPAPVIVMKDVGGLVRDYQAQTDFYRRTDREVRVHECHSACTLALSLPNVCVYPDSIFKFHQAYNAINRQTDLGVSDELWDAYPVPVRARLGTLTRQFKIMSGSELIAMGVRNCNTPRTMMAAKDAPAAQPGQSPALGAVWSNVMSVFGSKPTPSSVPARKPVLVATRQQSPGERAQSSEAVFARVQPSARQAPKSEPPATQLAETEPASASVDVPLPPVRPTSLETNFSQPMPAPNLTPILPKVIGGAQPILPPHFLAYAMIARLSR
jgi:hypothetical protein